MLTEPRHLFFSDTALIRQDLDRDTFLALQWVYEQCMKTVQDQMARVALSEKKCAEDINIIKPMLESCEKEFDNFIGENEKFKALFNYKLFERILTKKDDLAKKSLEDSQPIISAYFEAIKELKDINHEMNIIFDDFFKDRNEIFLSFKTLIQAQENISISKNEVDELKLKKIKVLENYDQKVNQLNELYDEFKQKSNAIKSKEKILIHFCENFFKLLIDKNKVFENSINKSKIKFSEKIKSFFLDREHIEKNMEKFNNEFIKIQDRQYEIINSLSLSSRMAGHAEDALSYSLNQEALSADLKQSIESFQDSADNRLIFISTNMNRGLEKIKIQYQSLINHPKLDEKLKAFFSSLEIKSFFEERKKGKPFTIHLNGQEILRRLARKSFSQIKPDRLFFSMKKMKNFSKDHFYQFLKKNYSRKNNIQDNAKRQKEITYARALKKGNIGFIFGTVNEKNAFYKGFSKCRRRINYLNAPILTIDKAFRKINDQEDKTIFVNERQIKPYFEQWEQWCKTEHPKPYVDQIQSMTPFNYANFFTEWKKIDSHSIVSKSFEFELDPFKKKPVAQNLYEQCLEKNAFISWTKKLNEDEWSEMKQMLHGYDAIYIKSSESEIGLVHPGLLEDNKLTAANIVSLFHEKTNIVGLGDNLYTRSNIDYSEIAALEEELINAKASFVLMADTDDLIEKRPIMDDDFLNREIEDLNAEGPFQNLDETENRNHSKKWKIVISQPGDLLSFKKTKVTVFNYQSFFNTINHDNDCFQTRPLSAQEFKDFKKIFKQYFRSIGKKDFDSFLTVVHQEKSEKDHQEYFVLQLTQEGIKCFEALPQAVEKRLDAHRLLNKVLYSLCQKGFRPKKSKRIFCFYFGNFYRLIKKIFIKFNNAAKNPISGKRIKKYLNQLGVGVNEDKLLEIQKENFNLQIENIDQLLNQIISGQSNRKKHELLKRVNKTLEKMNLKEPAKRIKAWVKKNNRSVYDENDSIYTSIVKEVREKIAELMQNKVIDHDGRYVLFETETQKKRPLWQFFAFGRNEKENINNPSQSIVSSPPFPSSPSSPPSSATSSPKRGD